jgi:hypothetical protein
VKVLGVASDFFLSAWLTETGQVRTSPHVSDLPTNRDFGLRMIHETHVLWRSTICHAPFTLRIRK